ncbi:MAG TPA: ParB N-terminal domain-containing protein, partial [Candidatus Bilamarchaeaceae archaeon]|nr:ParB N-terminal domain-containing protein [Candidatus Bilamarchaeaceae archaeon]
MKMLLDEMLQSLDIVEVSTLFPHEQTIASNVKRLKEAMLNIGQLVDPIVVDKKSRVVLDGNHRLKVLQVIECPLSACQFVD